jgi:hypothetical protein
LSRGHVFRPGLWIALEEKYGKKWRNDGCSCIVRGREDDALATKALD